MNEKRYIITKLFLTGILKDLTYTEETNVNFEEGEIYGNFKIIYKKDRQQNAE